jgi:hypothetical protein
MPTATRTFSFNSTGDGWTFSSGSAALTGGWFGPDGDPAGSIFFRSFGRNNRGTVTAQWIGTFNDLNVPTGTVVTGYSTCSYAHRAQAWVVGANTTSLGNLTAIDTATRTLVGPRTYSGLTSWATVSNTPNITGLFLPSTNTVTLRIIAQVDTANNASAEVRLLMDNIRVDVIYDTLAPPKYYFVT